MPTHTTSASGLKPPAEWRRRGVRRLRTSGGPRAPERVRNWLQAITHWLPAELESNLMLLTCELVNNSVLHGEVDERQVIEIELRATDNGLRAQVTDPGPGFAPTGRTREFDEPGGWGLVLVERLAASWGVERDDRTRVWFELAAA
jgi:anti-sigma regulatory factor (Ser/Thr protein kinase)